MLWGHNLEADGGFGFGADGALELFGEGDVVEERPWVVELGVPRAFEVAHGLEELIQLGVADEGNDGRLYAVGFGVVWGVIVARDSAECPWRFVDH